MTKPLRVLLVEDSEDDALLLLRALHKSGREIAYRRVETAEAMRAALAEEPWDIVISDYSLPGFGAGEALEVLKQTGMDLPFIIASGTIGEETAVAAMKAGAHDFLLKGQLARFLPAIDRELREAETRRDKKKAVEALRESERKYRQIVETAQEGIWMTDGEGKTTYANRRMAEMLGTTPDALLGALLVDFLVEDWERRAGAIKLGPAQKGVAEHHELKLRRRGGGEFWALLSTTPILDENERRTGELSMVMDVTEQRKLQEQLMVGDRMASIGTLAAGVAHEINNPLAAVLANLQFGEYELGQILKRVGEDRKLQEVQEGLRDACEAAERVRNIVRDLKMFSRSQEEVCGSVDVERVIDSSIRMAWPEIRHRARLSKRLRPVPPVLANESRLGQVCLNLLVNAAQAIEEGKVEENQIEVATDVDGRGNVVMEIKDSGAGMPPEVLRRLFTPFFTTKTIGVGTGLGLSICHRLISAMGGAIEVDSAVGRGSVFRIVLPAAPGDTPAAPPLRATTIPPPRRGKILVIDDEPVLLSTIRRNLANEHDVVATTSARDALQRIGAGERFDVILCDLMMPHMTGMDFYAELQTLAPDLARRVVFLTAGAFTPRAQAFLDKVESLRIEKPFDYMALAKLINERLR